MHRLTVLGAVLAAAMCLSTPATRAEAEVVRESIPTADVTFDGEVLFRVAEVLGIPVAKRASAIAGRVEAVADDRAIPPEGVHAVEEKEGATDILAGDRFIMSVTEVDARLAGSSRQILAGAYIDRLRDAVVAHRRDRESKRLMGGALGALVATLVFAVALLAMRWVFRRLEGVLDRRFHTRIKTFRVGSFPILHTEQLWTLIRRSLSGLRIGAYALSAYIWLQYTLSEFPWTRPAARHLLGYLLAPLSTIGSSVLAYLPNLAFLVVLVLVARYVLRLGRLFFDSVEGGNLTFKGFEPEWSIPTYKLFRIGIVGLFLVVAYPYLPGSESQAFKGLSLLFGVMLSLGSSSALSNVIAGYSLTYRRVFKVGDFVRIGEHTGLVTELRLQVTNLRTVKNEEVVVPNSQILGVAVVNFSTLAKKDGLILHTTVGIGYETPWRQVEAMLLLAAARTEGLKKDPKPFVLHQSLGDYAVNYELNVYTDDALTILAVYTSLHRNVLDVFNEYGVQIMTPSYMADPQQAKVVPPTDWYLSPARPRRVAPPHSGSEIVPRKMPEIRRTFV